MQYSITVYTKQVTFLLLSIIVPMLAAQEALSCEPVLEKHVQFLAGLTCSKTHTIHFAGMNFNDQLLTECLREIETKQSFVPLVTTWNLLKASSPLETTLMSQFSIILLLCYHASLSCYSHHYRLAWLSLITLYAQLNMVPLQKLFDALDECYQNYKIIIDTLPKDKNESWGSWLENYWWAPVTIIMFTAYSYLRWRQQHGRAL